MEKINLSKFNVVELKHEEIKIANGGGFWYDLGYALGSLFETDTWDTPGMVAYNTSSFAK